MLQEQMLYTKEGILETDIFLRKIEGLESCTCKVKCAPRGIYMCAPRGIYMCAPRGIYMCGPHGIYMYAPRSI